MQDVIFTLNDYIICVPCAFSEVVSDIKKKMCVEKMVRFRADIMSYTTGIFKGHNQHFFCEIGTLYKVHKVSFVCDKITH